MSNFKNSIPLGNYISILKKQLETHKNTIFVCFKLLIFASPIAQIFLATALGKVANFLKQIFALLFS
jgi:hypothetical protein